MKITGNEPALPQPLTEIDNFSYGSVDVRWELGGLTIRQQFAAQFYAARLAGLAFNLSTYSPAQVASLACADADALITELNK